MRYWKACIGSFLVAGFLGCQTPDLPDVAKQTGAGKAEARRVYTTEDITSRNRASGFYSAVLGNQPIATEEDIPLRNRASDFYSAVQRSQPIGSYSCSPSNIPYFSMTESEMQRARPSRLELLKIYPLEDQRAVVAVRISWKFKYGDEMLEANRGEETIWKETGGSWCLDEVMLPPIA